jgi:hypothetical protein
MTAASSHRTFPAWLLPALLALLLAAAIAAVILLARRASAPDVPPAPAAFQRPSPTRPVTTLDVQQAANGRLTLSDGSRDVALNSSARIESLQPVTADAIRPGDWLAVVGIPNEVRNFSIRSLILVGNPTPADAEGVVRSPGGFAGYEVSRDQNERPLLGGTVREIRGDEILLDGPAGPLTVSLTPRAPLYRLTESRPDDIREGDRLAFIGPGPVADATSLLVLPGGAQ